jgi:hypothetical protein
VNAGASPQIGDVTVMAPTPPTDQELAGHSLEEFVLHHATTHYVNTSSTGDLARWRGGRQSICPLTEGLTPGYNAFVRREFARSPRTLVRPCSRTRNARATCNYFSRTTPKKKWIPS